ncbi:MAG: hypothetical protein JST70_12635 [Bacteroidetes bacterium]|nr:hypothetical protein [Bacteroidota bacterium]
MKVFITKGHKRDLNNGIIGNYSYHTKECAVVVNYRERMIEIETEDFKKTIFNSSFKECKVCLNPDYEVYYYPDQCYQDMLNDEAKQHKEYSELVDLYDSIVNSKS